MIDLINDILDWHKNTFPEATQNEQEQKLCEEFTEYAMAIGDYVESKDISKDIKNLHKIKEELADVIISAVNLLNYPEIMRIVKAKMEINRSRVWGANHHIEEAEQENAG